MSQSWITWNSSRCNALRLLHPTVLALSLTRVLFNDQASQTAPINLPLSAANVHAVWLCLWLGYLFISSANSLSLRIVSAKSAMQLCITFLTSFPPGQTYVLSLHVDL